MGQILTILTAVHEHDVTLNALNEELSHTAHDLYRADPQSEARNRGEREDQGAVTEGSPEMIPNFMSRRDFKALATSSATTLSIGSTSNDARGTPSDGATDQERYTSWKTAYAAVRMATEITKESSDLCLPLKAVVGAMSTLMKNYDVSVSCWQTECLLTLFLLFFTPANIGQCKEREGYRAEGTVTIWCACFSCKRR